MILGLGTKMLGTLLTHKLAHLYHWDPIIRYREWVAFAIVLLTCFGRICGSDALVMLLPLNE